MSSDEADSLNPAGCPEFPPELVPVAFPDVFDGDVGAGAGEVKVGLFAISSIFIHIPRAKRVRRAAEWGR